MANKSDEGLLEYLENRTKFRPEAIEAAIAEMQTRGRVFGEEELSAYRREFEQRREITEKEDNEFWKPGNSWNKNIVTDETAHASR
ncbi:hypothetical protein [Anseongella ginsenosidimutans]|nr:hypothetical protein [Anseongella ginsenosidimutans]QEC53575.1 hypothetical protein FRZ59_15350 [Anseongella ginsenosidimutans]